MQYKMDIPNEVVVHAYKKLLTLTDEVFIIRYKGEFKSITSSTQEMLNIINKDKDLLLQKNYYKLDFYDFATTLLSKSCKYKTFHKFTVYKYYVHLNILQKKNEKNLSKLPGYLRLFLDLLKEKEVRIFLRKNKFERILE